MADLSQRILQTVRHKHYKPLSAKQLAKKLGVIGDEYAQFRKALRSLIADGRLERSSDSSIRQAEGADRGELTGVFRRTAGGRGFVRLSQPGEQTPMEVAIRPGFDLDAANGDEVSVRLSRRAGRNHAAEGMIIQVIARATRSFVGTYLERDGEAFVRVDGTIFAHSIPVGDPGAKGARPQDKVVIEMIRFPTLGDRGEAAIVEVLGPLSKPGVDVLSIIKAFNLPEEFPEAALAEARAQADSFHEQNLEGRTDFTQECVITIDPADARDFDDAVSVAIDPKTKHWILTVHIADVGRFAPAGGPLDQEARRRATSIYLPQKVIPMFPEIISNGLASLQEGRVRFVKTVRMEFTPHLQKAHVELFNGAIRVRKRFTYDQVQAVLDHWDGKPPSMHDKRVKLPSLEPAVENCLRKMRELAALLHAKRVKRGSLELTMPEAVLDYDDQGRVCGAHFAPHDESHRIIEEFMLAANEAVAEHFSRLQFPFLRRVHPMPSEEKLAAFAQFAESLGYPLRRPDNRFELQRILRETADKPERAAIHYSLLRSLKQAVYSPIQDEHFALASQHYCHFTSPIRRYPDLTVHRLLDRWLKQRKSTENEQDLIVLGDHCSKMERRAEAAERELVKLKILQYLSTRIGLELDAVITGVADYGFFAQAEDFPAEGLIHVSTLADDYYEYDQEAHALTGIRRRKRYRLGDRVHVVVARVDLQKRMLDFRLVEPRAKSRAK